MESPDVYIAAMSKSSAPWQGNAVCVASGQSARRCSDACDRRAPRGGKKFDIGLPGALSDRSGGGAQTISEECDAGLNRGLCLQPRWSGGRAWP